jgi:CCR4-NOT complex subunit CAF16
MTSSSSTATTTTNGTHPVASTAATATTTAKPLPSIPPYGDMAIQINDLSFSYTPDTPILHHLDLQLPTGSRCLLLGCNGSGKSTLLRILAGRHLTHPDTAVRVLGLHAFRDTRLNFHRAYLDCDWGVRSKIR